MHRYCGYNSLYQYCLKALELTENQACDYIRVARKALEIPELQNDINKGVLSVSKARRIIPVAESSNYLEWSAKAKSMSKRQLEKEIAHVNPRYNVKEHYQQMAKNLVQMQAPINQEVFNKLKRVQELLVDKHKKSIKTQDVLKELLDEYLYRHDPQEKAKRSLLRAKKAKEKESSEKQRAGCPGKRQVTKFQKVPGLGQVKTELNIKKPVRSGPSNKRTTVPQRVKYQVLEQAMHKCQWVHKDGSPCEEKVFLELHHKVPVSLGGENTPENLLVLCSGHRSTIKEEAGLSLEPINKLRAITTNVSVHINTMIEIKVRTLRNGPSSGMSKWVRSRLNRRVKNYVM